MNGFSFIERKLTTGKFAVKHMSHGGHISHYIVFLESSREIKHRLSYLLKTYACLANISRNFDSKNICKKYLLPQRMFAEQ